MEYIKSTKKKEFGEATERAIVVGLITSTEYIEQIRAVFDIALLEVPEAKKMASICLDFFDKYKIAPKEEFQKLFENELKIRPSSLMQILYEELQADEGLSKALNQDKEKEFNLQYLIDGTLALLKRRHWELHRDQVDELFAAEKLEDADKLVEKYRPLELTTTSKIGQFIWSMEELRQQNIEKPLLLMSPWLRAGQFTFIYGDYGTGKSLLAINIAYLLGLENYMEAECDIGVWQVKNPTGCLYVDGELGAVELRDRISKFEWLGKQRPDIKTLVFPLPEYQLASEDVFMLSERQNQLQIIQWFREHPSYKLLILDSVTTLFGLTEENSNSEWSTKINPLLRDLRALGIAVILLHHSGKDSRRGLRGASSMGAMAHNIFCLTNCDEKDVDEGEAWFTITKNKQRSGGFGFKTFSIHYSQNSDLTETIWEVTDGGTSTKEDKLTPNQIRILRNIVHGKKTQEEIAKRIGCTQSNISQTVARAKKLGYLTPLGEATPLFEELIDRFSND
jgi:AAA domain/MarR family